MPARVAFVLAALFAAGIAGSPAAAQGAASVVVRGAAEQPATRAAGATTTREVRFWPVAGAGLLGGAIGGGVGLLAGEVDPDVLDPDNRGDAGFQVPAVERRRVPLTPQLGWNVPFLHVQL